MNAKTTAPKPPSGLTRESRIWWRELQAEFDITDPGGRLLLMTLCESFDRMRLAQAAIKEDGDRQPDRFGQMKSHPLLVIERDSKSSMLQSLKMLNLDIEPLKPGLGRPKEH